jgi:hypothetical protein
MRRLVVVYVAIMLFGAGYVKAGTWSDFDIIGAQSTRVEGISDNYIVGYYSSLTPYQPSQGFLYDGTNCTSLNYPGAYGTHINGISGDSFVGDFGESYTNPYSNVTTIITHGFLFDGTNFTAINYPGAYATSVTGISGRSVVGWYKNAANSNNCGFLYDGTSYTTLNYPGYYGGTLTGISGTKIVGYLGRSDSGQGFVYDTTTQSWAFLPIIPMGIDGSNVVGGNTLYNITTQSSTALSFPGADSTHVCGISGNNIVGYYLKGAGAEYGFTYTIPEPATLLLLGIGGMLLRRTSRR